MTIAWVDNTGKIIGLTSDDGDAPASGLTPITPPPEHGAQVWDFAAETWGPKPLPLPDPDVELDAALAALDPATATVGDLIAVLRGQRGKKGRIAGRPV